MNSRTVELSPYWAAQADILLAKLDDPRSFTIEEIPVILGQARALAVRVTQMWDEAGDKQRAEADDDMREIGPEWDRHYYVHTPYASDAACRWCRERFLGDDEDDVEV